MRRSTEPSAVHRQAAHELHHSTAGNAKSTWVERGSEAKEMAGLGCTAGVLG